MEFVVKIDVIASVRSSSSQHGGGAGSGGARSGSCFDVNAGSEAQPCRSHEPGSSPGHVTSRICLEGADAEAMTELISKVFDGLRDPLLEALFKQSEEIRNLRTKVQAKDLELAKR